MSIERLRRIIALLQSSLFFKLVLIYLGTTVVLMFTIGIFIHLTFDRPQLLETPLGKHVQEYIKHLADRLGNPPQRSEALRLAQELGVQSHVRTAREEWTTTANFPSDSTLMKDPHASNQIRPFGRYHEQFFATLERQGVRYTFLLQQEPLRRRERRPFLWLVTLIGIVLGGSYLVVRWLFRPLSWLNQGVQEIARGNLAYQVPVRSVDELGRLTESFNFMSTRVREIVKAREQLLLDVSHELRSPLTRLKVGLEFVQEESVRTQLQQEARELETMITELLEAERLSSHYGGLQLTTMDLVGVVRELIETYHSRQPTIQLVSAPDALLLHFDVERVRIALRNICENALKYSPRDGPPITVRIQREESFATVTVRDYGPGLPPEEQARVFEPFYRVDKARERTTGGYGLGLSLAKKIMTAHGGDILLSSILGEGSTFTLQLPLSSD